MIQQTKHKEVIFGDLTRVAHDLLHYFDTRGRENPNHNIYTSRYFSETSRSHH